MFYSRLQRLPSPVAPKLSDYGGTGLRNGSRAGTTANRLRRRDPEAVRCRAQTSTLLNIHVDETSIFVPFSLAQADQVRESMKKLFLTFQEKSKAQRPQRWPAMQCSFAGSRETDDISFMELYCNPNIYSTPFDAKVLVTIQSKGGIKITAEAKLSAVKQDLDLFTEQYA